MRGGKCLSSVCTDILFPSYVLCQTYCVSCQNFQTKAGSFSTFKVYLAEKSALSCEYIFIYCLLLILQRQVVNSMHGQHGQFMAFVCTLLWMFQGQQCHVCAFSYVRERDAHTKI